MMKLYPLFAAIFLLNGTLLSQNGLDVDKKWRLSRMHWSIGLDVNQYNQMSHSDLINMSAEPEKLAYDLTLFQEEARTTTGGAFASFRWSIAPGLASENVSTEVQMGISLYSDKEAMVSFKNEELDSSIIFCNVHSEAALELAYLFSGFWDKKWRWHLGTGINAGTTFKNQMILLQGEYFEPGLHPSNQEISMSEPVFSEAKRVRYARVYVPFGLHYNLTRNVSIGLDFRKGFGWQFVPGQKANFIRTNLQMGLGLTYALI